MVMISDGDMTNLRGEDLGCLQDDGRRRFRGRGRDILRKQQRRDWWRQGNVAGDPAWLCARVSARKDIG